MKMKLLSVFFLVSVGTAFGASSEDFIYSCTFRDNETGSSLAIGTARALGAENATGVLFQKDGKAILVSIGKYLGENNGHEPLPVDLVIQVKDRNKELSDPMKMPTLFMATTEVGKNGTHLSIGNPNLEIDCEKVWHNFRVTAERDAGAWLGFERS